jgi:hypothetical protein
MLGSSRYIEINENRPKANIIRIEVENRDYSTVMMLKEDGTNNLYLKYLNKIE